MFCRNCGKQIRCTSKFCPGCGSPQPVQENLITAAGQNDQEAYTALYHQAEKTVRMTVYSIISPDGQNNADADDIIIESMVKGFNSLSQLTNPDSFTAWMRTIARNKSIDYLRKNRDITFSELTTEDGEDFEDTLVSRDISGSPEMSLDQKTKAALLRDILTSLPEEQRTVLVMYYYHEMKISEIAKELGCTEATVKSRLKYGKSKVEAGVGELEKKHGVKLYSFAPLLLLLLFRGSEKGLGENAGLQSRVLTAVSRAKTVGAAAAEGIKTAASSAVKTTASAGIKAGKAALRTKIIVIAASAVLGTGAVGAGTYAAVNMIRSARNSSAEERVQEQTESPSESYAPETADSYENQAAETPSGADSAESAEPTGPYIVQFKARPVLQNKKADITVMPVENLSDAACEALKAELENSGMFNSVTVKDCTDRLRTRMEKGKIAPSSETLQFKDLSRPGRIIMNFAQMLFGKTTMYVNGTEELVEFFR